MAVTTGGITFITLRGAVQLPGVRMEWLERANVDGVVLRAGGERGSPFEVRGFADGANAGAVESLRAAVAALKGETLTLNLGSGESYADVTVLDAACSEAEPFALVSGGVNIAEGGTGFRVHVRLECIAN